MPIPNSTATAYVVYGDDEKSPFVNVLHYFLQEEDELGTVEAGELAEAIDASVGPALKACLPEDARYIETFVRINQGDLVYESHVSGEADAGDLPGVTLPQGVAVVIRKRTAVPGRRGRGRWFVGCVAEDDHDSGKLLVSVVGRWQTLALSLAADQNVGGNHWVGAHLSRADDTMVPITAVMAMPVLQRQSRRALRPAF